MNRNDVINAILTHEAPLLMADQQAKWADDRYAELDSLSNTALTIMLSRVPLHIRNFTQNWPVRPFRDSPGDKVRIVGD